MAGQHPIIPPLPQAPAVVPPPANRVLWTDLSHNNFYTLISRHGPNQPLQQTFTGRFIFSQTLADGSRIARFDNLIIPNQTPQAPIITRAVMDNDWYYVPLAPPSAANPASRRGGKRTKVQRKKRKSKKSRKNCRK